MIIFCKPMMGKRYLMVVRLLGKVKMFFLLGLGVGIIFSITSEAWSHGGGENRRPRLTSSKYSRPLFLNEIIIAKGPKGRGEKEWQEKVEEWKEMSAREREILRRRYEQWNRMSPEDRNLYQRLFEQWQSLSLQERKRLKKMLDHWDELTPQQKERIRRRFRP
ncbi:MAG: DUF3106 domain-containing protein [Deltaproteobacteria bacterium]|nr:DUF3106 domain-containing protein [Deltaproteobacteria bacterium]MBW2130657.1 DUF3106 domain-containing protein [Deltaproteobacteria bacterium]MBW2304705.1 DUF3106 domain-containing protein [Deltaproteobacteria bacterium]